MEGSHKLKTSIGLHCWSSISSFPKIGYLVCICDLSWWWIRRTWRLFHRKTRPCSWVNGKTCSIHILSAVLSCRKFGDRRAVTQGGLYFSNNYHTANHLPQRNHAISASQAHLDHTANSSRHIVAPRLHHNHTASTPQLYTKFTPELDQRRTSRPQINSLHDYFIVTKATPLVSLRKVDRCISPQCMVSMWCSWCMVVDLSCAKVVEWIMGSRV